MSETCTRCESAYDEFGVCPNGHQRALAESPVGPPCPKCGFVCCVCEVQHPAITVDPFVCEIADVIASGLRHHLRNAAREYLERLIKELDTA